MGHHLQQPALWPLALYFGLVILTVVGMLVLSYFLGQHHMERGTGEPYESGITTTGSPRIRFDVKYYLIAMFFVIFDLESIFIFAWAIALRESGWRGFIEIGVFIGILLAALGYLWRLGALEWAELQRKSLKAYKAR